MTSLFVIVVHVCVSVYQLYAVFICVCGCVCVLMTVVGNMDGPQQYLAGPGGKQGPGPS